MAKRFDDPNALSRRALLRYGGAVLAASTALPSTRLLAQAPANAAELDAKLFPGFETRTLSVNGASIHTVIGGDGPPLLLLHGAPQSHLSWAQVAVELARDHTIVAPDLRGYGWSSKPDGGENHVEYSKRTMANDNVDVMRTLGFDRFSVAGHDRGGRVARRMALDHPARVTDLTVLDIVPTHYLYAHVTREFVEAYFHWFLFIRPAPFPENVIAATGLFIGGGPGETGAAWAEVYKDPAAIHSMCEDYRAAAGIDITHDEADIAVGKNLECPLNALWGSEGAMGRQYDVLAIWREEGNRVEGKAMPGGHNFLMDSPAATAGELRRFVSSV